MMRKMALILSLGAISVSFLSGCKNKNKYKVPTNAHDKVQVAFNGVEKTFANYKTSSSSSSATTRSVRRVGQGDTSGALSDIVLLYKSSYDSQGDRIDELEYDQPPMIQFQCLKKTFDSIGSGYTFGTKYVDTIYGTAYFDPTTGDKKDVSDLFKYDYAFTFALAIDIDSNDVINADVSFKIRLTHENATLETNWFVTMILDYEMSKESPTYTLSMFTDNEQSELEFREYGNVYEYDYVDMKDGRINEWRKFCYEVNKRMVKDSTHTKFSDYINEPGFKAQIGASKWYKNGNLNKFTHPTSQITNSFISALFDKLGLNSSDIDCASFNSKSGTVNSVLGQVYKEFSNLFKQDVIYNLVTNNGQKVKKVRNSMAIKDSSYQDVNHITLSEDTTLKTLLSGGDKNYTIWYFDENGDALEPVENLDTVQLYFTIPYGTSGQEKVFNNTYLEHNISSLYEELGRQYYEEREQNDFYAYLRIRDSLTSLHTVVEITTDSNLQSELTKYFKSLFPYQILDLGFPSYDGENCLYEYRSGKQKIVDITDTNQNELDAFYNKLDLANWTRENHESQIHFNKLGTGDNSNKLFEIDVEAPEITEGIVRIFYTINEIQRDPWPQADILSASNGVLDLAAPFTKNGYFNVNLETHVVTMKNFTQSEIDSLLETLRNLDDESGLAAETDEIDALNIRKGNYIYHLFFAISNSEIELRYEITPESTFHYYEINIEKDGAFYAKLSLNDDLSMFYLKQTFEPGVYKVKATDLAEGTPAEEWMINNTGNLDYDQVTKELNLTEETELTFSAQAFNPVNVELL